MLRPQGQNQHKYLTFGIYRIKCHACNNLYVCQTGRQLNTRFHEHWKYIKTNNPQSVCVVHVLNQHECDSMANTVYLIKSIQNGWCMNCHENFYIQMHQQ